MSISKFLPSKFIKWYAGIEIDQSEKIKQKNQIKQSFFHLGTQSINQTIGVIYY